MILDLSKPKLMGILNLTPDSFSDGGEFGDVDQAMIQLQKLQHDGADIIDIGAESTFGPSSQVSAEEEWQRLEPILQALDYDKTFVSVDTWKASVAEQALQLGVQMINDVTALRGDDRMHEVLLEYTPYICLMYSADETPYATRSEHHYEDVMETVGNFLQKHTRLLLDAGFPREKIIIDPGLGFFLSSNPGVSWEVINRLKELKSLGFPILIGPSMKSFLGGEISQRGPASIAAAELCIRHGADMVRTHDIAGLERQLKTSETLDE